MNVVVFRVHVVVGPGGKRMPVLLRSDSDFPAVLPTRYYVQKLAKLRRPSTIASELRAVGWFYSWGKQLKRGAFEPETRLMTPDPLSRAEVSSLAAYFSCGRTETSSGEGVISNKHLNDTLVSVRKFLEWAFTTQASPIPSAASISKMVAFFQGERLPEPNSALREGLSDRQQTRLREVCGPLYPSNPFNRQTRIRNQALITLLLEAPLRRGEFLKLRLADLELNGPPGEALVKVVVRPDDPGDPRKVEPRQKTLGRDIPITDETKRTLIRYLRTRSSKWPYVFVSTRGDGRPMDPSSVNDIFAVIATAFPDDFPELYPHLLRHTWNDKFILQNHRAPNGKLRETELAFTQNYLNGWSDRSNTARRYHRRATREVSNETLRKYQAGK